MQRTCRVRVALPVALLLTWSLPAATIARVMTLDNPIRLPFSGFASSLAVIGDVDDDGIADYLVGAYDHRVNTNEHQGRAFVFSSRSGKVLYTIDAHARWPTRRSALRWPLRVILITIECQIS